MNKIFISALCTVLFLFSTCELGLQKPLDETDAEAPNGKILLHIGIQNAGRSILPQFVPAEITAYELSGNAGSGAAKLADFTTIEGASISVDGGTWDFTLKAFKGNDLLLQGDITDRVITASGASLAFVLLPPTQGGEGAISVTITFPTDAGITSAVAITAGTTPTTENMGISTTEDTNIKCAVYTKPTVASGDYFISFQLKHDETVLAVVSELVLVRAKLTSSATIPLTYDDLKFTEMVPTEFIVVSALKTQVSLQWDPVAGASSYTVYRSATTDGNYTQVGTNITTSTYTDTGLSALTTYYYKVSASNSNGAQSALTAALSAKTTDIEISTFAFSTSTNTEINGTHITVTVPNIINLTQLVPTIEHSGASITPASGEAHDFSNGPVTYTVTTLGGKNALFTVTVVPTNRTLVGALAWIAENVEDEDEYTIPVMTDELIGPTTLNYDTKIAKIILKGRGTDRTVTLNHTGSLFTIGSMVTLELENITLQGISENTTLLVNVQAGGELIMQTGAKITGNTRISSTGNPGAAGVFVNQNGTFTMHNGEISGNTLRSTATSSTYSAYGGGVYVASGGTFTMNNGKISGNTAAATASAKVYGGGVDNDGTFIMCGGEISGNTASSSSYPSYGGGVSSAGTFTMENGKISGNTSNANNNSAYGGGVYIGSGTFTMHNNGEISGNTVCSDSSRYSAYGGGVYVADGSSFIMNNGKISKNTAKATILSAGGGGVCNYSTFIMNGGEISENTATASRDAYGGGVYNYSTFTMNTGKINGNTADSTTTSTSYTVRGGGVYNYSTFTMNAGEISDNTASVTLTTIPVGGGGVYNSSTFTMKDGKISENKILKSTNGGGGGVYTSSGSGSGTFTMNAGEISGNRVPSNGGGVYAGGTFKKVPLTGTTSGIINGSDIAPKNVAGGTGQAVYVYVSSTSSRKRDTTAGETDGLDSTKAGFAGGWD